MTTSPSSPSNETTSSHDDQDLVIAETQFAGPYKSSLLSHLSEKDLEVLSYVNCSYLSHPSGKTLSLATLKSHAQSLCALIAHVDVTDSTITSNAFDFLVDFSTAYQTNSSVDHLPLNSIKNTIATTIDIASGDRAYFEGCPIKASAPAHVRYLEHANELLETIDEMFIADGGLLATLPAPNTPERASSDKTLLGQLLSYVSQLTARISELEIDVVRMRDVLASEAAAPKILSASRATRDGIPIAFPQDHYVLADLDAALWSKLNTLLNTEEARNANLQAELDANTRPEASFAPIDSDTHADIPHIDLSSTTPYPRAAVIDVTSRLYRLPGHSTIFMIPGFGEHPHTEATRTLVSRPFVTTLPWSAGSSSGDNNDINNPPLALGAAKRLREELAQARALLDQSSKTEQQLRVERDHLRAGRDIAAVKLVEATDQLELWRTGRLVRDQDGLVRKVPGEQGSPSPRPSLSPSEGNQTSLEEDWDRDQDRDQDDMDVDEDVDADEEGVLRDSREEEERRKGKRKGKNIVK
jgi:hypothetical protein